MRCTKAIIYKENITHNILAIRKLLKPQTKICCAVKADGYGTNAVLTAKIAADCGAEYLAIATVEEGIELRNNGIKLELLLLSLCTKEELVDVRKNNITPLLFDSEMIKEYNKVCNSTKEDNSKEKAPVFLAIDTGMGRIGCKPNEAALFAKEISECKNIFLGGTITHFAVSDSITKENKEYTKEQFSKFKEAIKSIEQQGINPGIRTCSSSAAAIDEPELQLDMVRPGIVIYGYYPDQITQKYLETRGINLDLKPVMQLETQVVSIRHFTPGNSISYGRTWICQKETDIAVLPIGYADGLLRRNSPGLLISINKKLYPVVGRICMDQCMVDIGLNNKDVKRWDKAIIFGPKDKESLQDAQDIATINQTISYEIMTSITKRVHRLVE